MADGIDNLKSGWDFLPSAFSRILVSTFYTLRDDD